MDEILYFVRESGPFLLLLLRLLLLLLLLLRGSRLGAAATLFLSFFLSYSFFLSCRSVDKEAKQKFQPVAIFEMRRVPFGRRNERAASLSRRNRPGVI